MRRMWCHDPEKRINTTLVVFEFECLVVKEEALAQGDLGHSAMNTKASTINANKNGEVMKRWEEIQTFFDEYEDLSHLHQALVDLRELYHQLETGKYRQTILPSSKIFWTTSTQLLRLSHPPSRRGSCSCRRRAQQPTVSMRSNVASKYYGGY
jgi:hypothetical protein